MLTAWRPQNMGLSVRFQPQNMDAILLTAQVTWIQYTDHLHYITSQPLQVFQWALVHSLKNNLYIVKECCSSICIIHFGPTLSLSRLCNVVCYLHINLFVMISASTSCTSICFVYSSIAHICMQRRFLMCSKCWKFDHNQLHAISFNQPIYSYRFSNFFSDR